MLRKDTYIQVVGGGLFRIREGYSGGSLPKGGSTFCARRRGAPSLRGDDVAECRRSRAGSLVALYQKSTSQRWSAGGSPVEAADAWEECTPIWVPWTQGFTQRFVSWEEREQGEKLVGGPGKSMRAESHKQYSRRPVVRLAVRKPHNDNSTQPYSEKPTASFVQAFDPFAVHICTLG
jgi:hypothetical protein